MMAKEYLHQATVKDGQRVDRYVYPNDPEWDEIIDSGDLSWTWWRGNMHRGLGQGCFWTED